MTDDYVVGGGAVADSDTSARPATEPEAVRLTDLTDEELIVMDIPGQNKEEVFKELLGLPALNRYITDHDSVLTAVKTREEQSTTGMGEGIAIPHAKSPDITEATLVVARSENGVDWDSMDGGLVKIIFLILVPERQKGDFHLKILQLLSRNLMHEDFRQAILNANTKEEVYDVLSKVES